MVTTVSTRNESSNVLNQVSTKNLLAPLVPTDSGYTDNNLPLRYRLP